MTTAARAQIVFAKHIEATPNDNPRFETLLRAA